MDPRPAYSRIDLLCCSISLHLKGTWETQNHQAFCVSLVLVSFTLTYRAACPLLVKHSTINLSLTSEESLTDSKLPDTGYLRTKGQESVYETCACVIHTILLSYMCINIVSHSHSCLRRVGNARLCLRGVHVLREALVEKVTHSLHYTVIERKHFPSYFLDILS